MYKSFYKKTVEERKNILEDDNRYDENLDIPLDQSIYNQMIENAISTYEVPLGVAPGFMINGRDTVVAMATEEPSVIAAASNAAKIIGQNSGFEAAVLNRKMTGHIAFANPKDPEHLIQYINENLEVLFNICHNAYPSIVKRGGGVRNITVKELYNEHTSHFIVVYVTIDTQEAMGANMINTMLEGLASYLQDTLGEEPLMSILSNLATECLVNARVLIDPQTLKNSEIIASKIQLASEFASLDPYRATTHNKGIMNGIDAVVLASGNDTRAVSAGIHAFASLSGSYQPLAKWVRLEDGMLLGELTIPLAVGSVGGSIGIHPKAQLSRKIMAYDSAQELMEIIACVGLAQNFAALYALTTDGIQKGHMALQARALALQAGATEDILSEVVETLRQRKPMNLETAKRIIQELKK